DAEHRGVRANTKCQREDRNGAEPRRLSQLTCREPHVLHPLGKPLDGALPTRVACRSPCGVLSIFHRITKPPPGFGVCLGVAHAAIAKLCPPHLEVEVDLVVGIPQQARTTHGEGEQAAYASREESRRLPQHWRHPGSRTAVTVAT